MHMPPSSSLLFLCSTYLSDNQLFVRLTISSQDISQGLWLFKAYLPARILVLWQPRSCNYGGMARMKGRGVKKGGSRKGGRREVTEAELSADLTKVSWTLCFLPGMQRLRWPSHPMSSTHCLAAILLPCCSLTFHSPRTCLCHAPWPTKMPPELLSLQLPVAS